MNLDSLHSLLPDFHVTPAVVAAFALGLFILQKLRNLERINRAAITGKTAEVQNAWKLHDLYSAVAWYRANNNTGSEDYRRTVNAIRRTHAVIADAYDPTGKTKNVETFLKEEAAREKMTL